MEPHVEQSLFERARHLSSATVHEAAGKIGALPSALKPLHPSFVVCGQAFPVQSPPGDNLWLHRTLAAAQPGDVLVVSTSGAYESGYWGEVMTRAAQVRQLAGLVIDGGVRDSQRLIALGFPVFSHGICIRGTGKDPLGAGSLYEPIRIGDVVIHHGDLVLGDADGVVVIPREQVATVVDLAEARDAAEAEIFERIARGETTMEIYRLP